MARKPPTPPIWAYVVAAGLIYFAYTIHDVLVPFILSFALAYLLNPVINYFEVRGFRREQIVLAMYLVVTVIVTLSANLLIPAVT